ncbi:sulfatase [Virgibacillus soli]|uniref:sulfatase family protein n=1 Tax=Lederbergia galactosidilytica TaxID=217031 RepID=UPI00071336D0|nr:sulfatase-like hydrolase/transferase [Lederbergia galactosidilytica]KRG16378.1 sulfatase [Virgibacillus soli]MBP1914302.1 arylsulfatase A-like enzyme [Lederbergia galactosidilytica]
MEHPNILWITTDQQRFDTLGCYGNKFVHTPNIDKLATSGVLFEQCYSNSTVCTPSRASFLTGRYPRTNRTRQNGQSIPNDEILVTKLLAAAGYTCGLAGKLHISACNPSISTTRERRINDGYTEFNWSHHPNRNWASDDYQHWLIEKDVQVKKRKVEGMPYIEYGPEEENHQTTWCAQKAINFIKNNADFENPWLFSVNMFDPHHPFDPPEAYLKRYIDMLDEIPLPNYRENELDEKPIFQQIDHDGAYGVKGLFPASKMSEKDHKILKAAYWAMVDLIDKQVGRIMNVLEETGQLENTIIIFMSDHGEMLGDHGIYLKGPHFYDPAVKVPFIISYPSKIRGNRRMKTMVELVDIAPTLLEASGQPCYTGMQGKSLWDLLINANVEHHRNDVYCEFYDDRRGDDGQRILATMLRTENYKLVIYHGMDDGELYDLDKDPDESSNCWNHPDYQSVKMKLFQRLHDRMLETIDPLPEKEAAW